MTDSPAPRDQIAAMVETILRSRTYDRHAYDEEVFMECVTEISESIVSEFPVLAAEPTTTADALKRSREAIQEVLDSPLVPSGGNSIRAAQVALVLNERGLLAALAPEPTEERTIGYAQDVTRDGHDYIVKMRVSERAGEILDLKVNLALDLVSLPRRAVVSPDEPKPLDPNPYRCKTYPHGREQTPVADCDEFKPRPEFDQDESHYPKDGK